jgi:UDP-glucose:(heptosyl)LPS alpha-1,3-glucosyltransferase
MKLAFCLFKYFPFGGMQRNFLRIAETCLKRGNTVDVFALEWEGPLPQELRVNVLPVRRILSHQRYEEFVRRLAPVFKRGSYDAVIGFNKIPGLDVYYAADPCFQARVRRDRGPLYRLTGRYRHFVAFERAVFDPAGNTEILLLSEPEREEFIRYYGTSAERFHLLPPSLAEDRLKSLNRQAMREELRREFSIAPEEKLLLLVGSGFRMKGLDRALRALAALPDTLRKQTRFFVLGQDDPRRFLRLADRLRVHARVQMLGGRGDVPRFLAAADLLIHPAYFENTGNILLEAMAFGLPVLATDVCGYAVHVSRAGAGCVLPSPFDQRELDSRLVEMLTSEARDSWREKGLRYAKSLSTHSRAEVAADVIEAKAREKAGAKTMREAAVARVE